MTLVHEDGTGLANAESFASVSTADTYFADPGNAAWAVLTTMAKEQALRLATDHMGAMYGALWRGYRKTETQALDWPRVGWAGVPVAIERACCELAVRASEGPLTADEGPQVESEQVGPIGVVYAPGARQNVRHAHVWNLLGPFLQLHLIVARA